MKKSVALLCALVALSAFAQSEAPAQPAAEGVRAPRWFERIEPFGYAKAGYFFVTPAADDALVGAHNGFRLVNLRVGLSLRPAERLEVVASVDGSVGKRNELDPLKGARVVDLKDGYLEWSASRFAVVRLGQFKAPFDEEALLPDGQLPFIGRSVISDGLTPPEGYPVEGLSLDRQVGLQIASERLGTEAAGFRYALALVNGNGSNLLNNDSNALAPVARVSYEYKDLLRVGLNGYLNERLEGDRPNRVSTTRVGVGGDVGLKLGGVEVLAVVLSRQTSHAGNTLPSESALGWMGQVHYLHAGSGLEGGVRVANLEPSSLVAQDAQTEAAAMVGYRLKEVPLRVLAQYTLRLEEASVAMGNDSIDVMAQVSW